MATLRTLLRWAMLTSLLSVLLFIAAGSTRIPLLRDYIAVLSALLLFTMISVDPGLARERSHPAGIDLDPASRTASGFLFLVTIVFAALDVGRLHQSDGVPPSWHLPAILAFSAAMAFQAAAMIVNPYFSPALRIQTDRGHSVISCGPYRAVRHPGYVAMFVAVPASALAIGSWLALIPAVAFGAVIVRRTALEDRYLRQELSGYLSYAKSVRYRLVPGIW